MIIKNRSTHSIHELFVDIMPQLCYYDCWPCHVLCLKWCWFHCVWNGVGHSMSLTFAGASFWTAKICIRINSSIQYHLSTTTVWLYWSLKQKRFMGSWWIPYTYTHHWLTPMSVPTNSWGEPEWALYNVYTSCLKYGPMAVVLQSLGMHNAHTIQWWDIVYAAMFLFTHLAACVIPPVQHSWDNPPQLPHWPCTFSDDC